MYIYVRIYYVNLRIRMGYCVQTHNIIILYEQTVCIRVGSANIIVIEKIKLIITIICFRSLYNQNIMVITII